MFDLTILKSELYRYHRQDIVDKINNITEYCTMKNSTEILKLPCAREYGYKSPKLIELYRYYFKNQNFDCHDALEDVKACARCYFKLTKKLDINTLPKKKNILENNWEEWETTNHNIYYYNTLNKKTQWEKPDN